MDLKVMSELCADSRTVPLIPGMHLNLDAKSGLGGAGHPQELAGLERMPSITSVIYPSDAAGTPLPTNFRNRLPLEALDKTGYLPSDAGSLDVPGLVALSDRVGHMVQVPKGNLAPPPDELLPKLHDRLVPLNAEGFTTTWGQASWIRVQPTESPTVNSWSSVPEVARIMQQALAGQTYLAGRIVPGPDGYDIGLPSGFVNEWHREAATRFGRPLNLDDIATARAGGAGSPSVLPGYVELMRRLEQSPPNSQALVRVDDAAGKSHVFLADHDGFNVSILDLGPGDAAAKFPRDHGAVELTTLPGTMPLDDRIDSLRSAGQPQPTQLVRPLLLPAEVQRYQPADKTGLPIVVVGPVTAGSTSFLDGLARNAPDVGQPIVVIGGIGRDGVVPGNRVDGLRTVLVQEGLHGQVPVVVIRAGLKAGAAGTTALHDILDEIGASLVHPVPSGLGSAWTLREAKGDTAPVGSGPGKRLFDELGLPLLQLAAGDNRRPKQAAPPAPVANFLTTPFPQQVGSKALQDLFGPGVKKLAPLVQQIATREPMFAGNNAAFQLAAMDQADTVTTFAGDPRNGRETLFKPMLSVPGGTPAERQQGVQTLLPLLADLAGGYGMTDNASHGILTALNAKLQGTMDDHQIRDMIWDRKDHLPESVRPSFVRLISDVKKQVPDTDGASYDQVAEWILTCPDPE
jgi:hypothetical protein